MANTTLHFNVPEMDCNHCVHSITEAIHRIDPAAQIQADLNSKQLRVSGTADAAAYEAAIEDAGFDAEKAA